MMVFISDLFRSIFAMSVNASIVAILIIIIRLVLKKSPQIFSLMLWLVVFFRLLCPITIQSEYGIPILLQSNISQDTNSGLPIFLTSPIITEGQANQPYLLPTNATDPTWITSSNLYSTSFNIMCCMWFLGVIVLILYGFVSYILLKRRMQVATKIEGKIFVSDRIKTPFVLGIIRPRIYIPKGIEGSEFEYILKHEQTHIRRYDYLFKLIAFLAVALHWFNPIVWISYSLMSQDMELSADESVLKKSTIDMRKAYAALLVRLSSAQGGLLTSLPFSKTCIESRVQNILNYKKSTFWVYTVSLVAVIGVGGVLLGNDGGDIDDSLAWAHNLSVNDVQSIETVISPSDKDTQYKKISSQEFKVIVKTINSSKGRKVDAPDETGSTITLYITTQAGTVHTYQNLMNTYLVIDNAFFLADSVWLENSFKQFKGDASIPDGFYERVTGVTTTYNLIELGEDGKALRELSSLEGTDRQLAEGLVYNYMTKSTLSPTKDIYTFDECYLLRVIYSKNNLNETHDYYLFKINGNCYIQNDKDGFNVEIEEAMYNDIVNLINSIHATER